MINQDLNISYFPFVLMHSILSVGICSISIGVGVLGIFQHILGWTSFHIFYVGSLKICSV
jgi:hypothetical protein